MMFEKCNTRSTIIELRLVNMCSLALSDGESGKPIHSMSREDTNQVYRLYIPLYSHVHMTSFPMFIANLCSCGCGIHLVVSTT